jgi:5'-nucleotidase
LAPACEWVLSGINEGGNLGADVYHSGTVAAVREAALLGKPGVAFSQYRRRRSPIDWNRAAAWTATSLAWILARPTPPGSFWNVNFPDLEPGAPTPTIVECSCDTHPLPVRFQVDGNAFLYRGKYHLRLREDDRDVAICFGGQIAVTRFAVR